MKHLGCLVPILALFLLLACENPVAQRILGETEITISFDVNGAAATPPAPITLKRGDSIKLPSGSGLAKANHDFSKSWNTRDDGSGTDYKADGTFRPTRSMTLFAKWDYHWVVVYNVTTGDDEGFTNLEKAFDSSFFQDAVQAVDGCEVIITAQERVPQNMGPYVFSTSGKVTLKAESDPVEIQLSGTGSLFTVNSGVTLILDADIALVGKSTNTASLVHVNGGTLRIKEDSKISGNTANEGGAVYVDVGGTFVMEGGNIFGNKANKGGGVFVNGNLFMQGGIISANVAREYGGGVYVDGSASLVKMGGGTITGWGDDTISGNVVGDFINPKGTGNGYAVYAGSDKIKDSTAMGDLYSALLKDAGGGWD